MVKRQICIRPIYTERLAELHTFMNPALNEHFMSAQCMEKAVTQDPYVLLKYSSLFCLGTTMNCNLIWLDASNIQWGEGIIHLEQMAWNTKCNSTARSAEHALLTLSWQLPQRLWKVYMYYSSLCLAMGLANISSAKIQKLLNLGVPTRSGADPNPERTKWLLPLKHRVKHKQDK